MKNSLKIIIISVLVLTVFVMCRRRMGKPSGNDTATSGTVQFAADESFQPILDEEIFVFQHLYTETKPVMLYKPEAQALKLFLEDSVRVAILSRELYANEVQMLAANKLTVEVTPFAIDAIALIVNKESIDTAISVNQLKAILNGKAVTDRKLVFDNPNSSLVRYLKDLSGADKLSQKNVYSLASNKAVIKYVSENKDAIGIVGFSWLDDPDGDFKNEVDKVKVMGVRDESNKVAPQTYFKPSQTTLALKQYPLSRRLYILNSTARPGMAKAMADFLSSERGQRIILKSGLLPDSIPQREIHVKE